MKGNGAGKHVSYADYAQNVWQSLIHAAEAGVTQAPDVQLRVGSQNVEELKDATVKNINYIEFETWSGFADAAVDTSALLYVTPKSNNKIAVNGESTFTYESIPVQDRDGNPIKIPALTPIYDWTAPENKDAQQPVHSLQVMSQADGGATQIYTYNYVFIPASHQAELVGDGIDNGDKSIVLPPNRDLKVYMDSIAMPTGAIATWTLNVNGVADPVVIVVKNTLAGKEYTVNGVRNDDLRNLPGNTDFTNEINAVKVSVQAECGEAADVVKYNETVIPTPTYDITVNYTIDGVAAAAAPAGVTVTGTTTGLANGDHTLTLTVDDTKYTVDASSDLKAGDNTVTVNGADMTLTVVLNTVTAPAGKANIKVNFHNRDGSLAASRPEISLGEFNINNDGKIQLGSANAIKGTFVDSNMTIIAVYGKTGIVGAMAENEDIWEVSGIPTAGGDVVLNIVLATKDDVDNNRFDYDPQPLAARRAVARAAASGKVLVTGRWFPADAHPREYVAEINPQNEHLFFGADLENARRSIESSDKSQRLWMIDVTVDDSVTLDQLGTLGISFFPKGNTPGEAVSVKIVDGKNNTLTGWSRYADITVDGQTYTAGMEVKSGQVLNVTAKTVSGMKITVSINGGEAGTTAALTVGSEPVVIVVNYKDADFAVRIVEGTDAWGITGMPSTATPSGVEGTYTFDMTVTTGREPRAVVNNGGANVTVKYTPKNPDRTQWTITLENVTTAANTTVTVSTIKQPVVTVYVDPADQKDIQILEQKAEPDGESGTICTFVATMKDSTDVVPTGPNINENITPLGGAKVTYEKHDTLPNTWIGTISGIQGDKSFQLESVNLKKVFFVNDAKTVVKLPTDSKDAPQKNFVFAAPNGDFELKDIQLQDGYTLIADAKKVTNSSTTPVTVGVATVDTIKFTKADNGTYTLTSNLLAETSVSGYATDSMDDMNAVRVIVKASIGNLVELVPQSGINMTTAGTTIVSNTQQAPVNGTVTYQLSMKKGFYPVISSNVKKPDGTAETLGVIQSSDWSISTTNGISVTPENDRLTWTVSISTNASGKLALDCDAMPGAAIVNVPTGVAVDEPRSFVSLASYNNKGVPATFKAEFIVEVQEDYQLLNASCTTVEGWPQANKTITRGVDGSWTVEIVSISNTVGGAQVYLQSEKLHSVQLIIPEELQEHVTIGKSIGYAGETNGRSTIDSVTFTLLVDDGWELTEAGTWKQTDGMGLGYSNATMSHTAGSLIFGKREYTVTASDVKGDAIITVGARSSVSASAILRSNSGDISIVEQGSVEAVNGVATFHVYVTNGMGIILASAMDPSVELQVVKDSEAEPRTGMTAYIVEASGIRNGLVPVNVEVKDLIQVPLTVNGDGNTGTVADRKDGYVITGRPGGAIMEASVYGYEAVIIGDGGLNSNHWGNFAAGKVGVKDINILKGYKPVGTSGIGFSKGSTSGDYTVWSVEVTPNPGDVDITYNTLAKDVSRTFEIVSD